MDKPTPEIVITENGPYEVKGSVPLARETMMPDESGIPHHWVQDEVLETEETYWLCRCGHSKNKPFCDDSHLTAGFDGTETALNEPFDDMAVTFSGPDVEYKDVKVLCASGRFCVRGGGIRQLTEQPFGPEARNMVIEEAFNCPAGKLVAIDKNTGEALEPVLEKGIAVANDPGRGVSGPLVVRGGIRLVSYTGVEYEVRNRMALCRCGESRNKPFCDGSHIRVNFQE